MNHSIDWATKKAQGRVKDIGVPWTEEELIALKSGEATVEGLRGGDAAPSKPTEPKAPAGEKALEKMNKGELTAKAEELGLTVSPDATKAELVDQIKEAIAQA